MQQNPLQRNLQKLPQQNEQRQQNQRQRKQQNPRALGNKYGFSSLTEQELVAVILRSGSSVNSVFMLAETYVPILRNGLEHDIPVDKFLTQNLDLLPKSIALQSSLLALYDLILRIKKEYCAPITKPKTPQSLAEQFSFLANKKHEIVYGVYFSPQLVIKNHLLLAKGSTDYVCLEPCDVFYYAIKYRCRQFAIVHNHPSGEIVPSEEDRKQTMRLKAAAELLNLHFVDHLIVARKGYYSFKESSNML